MMQILEAGGIAPFTDGIRSADHDNPKGYFEWEDIKRIERDHRIIEPVVGTGKAIKVISTLLPKLPKAHQYKVIFVKRDIGEVIQSQQKMLASRGGTAKADDPDEAASRLKKHNDQIIRWMDTAPHIDALIVDHRKLVQNPANQIPTIVRFLEQDTPPPLQSMVAVVDPELYRNRSKSGLLTRLSSWLR